MGVLGSVGGVVSRVVVGARGRRWVRCHGGGVGAAMLRAGEGAGRRVGAGASDSALFCVFWWCTQGDQRGGPPWRVGAI